MEIKFKKRKTILKLTSQEFGIIIEALKGQDEICCLENANDEEIRREMLAKIERRMED